MRKRLLLAMPGAVFVTLLIGCIAGTGRGYPMYPATGGALDASKVARLRGYVRYVDGEDVTEHGTDFELLPGCHLIGTPSHWGTASTSGGIGATTGTVTFALPMRADYQYVVAVEVGVLAGGPSAPIAVRAYEKNARGETIHVFGPAMSGGDVARCREVAGRPASGAAPQTETAARAVSTTTSADIDIQSATIEPNNARAESRPVPPPCPETEEARPAQSSGARGTHAPAIAAWARYRIFPHGGPFCAVNDEMVLGCGLSEGACEGRCEPICTIYCLVSHDAASENPSLSCYANMNACKRQWEGLPAKGQIGQYGCEAVSVPQ